MSFDLSEYVDVPERLRMFYERHSEGSMQGNGEFVRDEQGRIIGYVYRALAYRSPEDIRPGIGTAFEPIPGKTPYTRDSEVQNAETSAWGRAIVACGFETKKIASADEVRSRSAGEPGARENHAKPTTAQTGSGSADAESSPAESFPVPRASAAVIAKVDALIQKVADHRGATYNATRDGVEATYGPLPEIKTDKAQQLVRQLEKAEKAPVPTAV